MPQGGACQAFFFTAAFLAQVLEGLARRRAEKAFEDKIRQQAEKSGGSQLAPQKTEQNGQRPRAAEQNGDSLIRSGQKNRQQGSRGNQAASVEVGGGHREAALGYAAQQSPTQRPPGSGLGEGGG